jgi:membrane-associated phospholipid phosphatase
LTDPDIERVARFLAAHAVLLLAIGLVAASVALLAIVSAVRVAVRYRAPVIALFTTLMVRARDVEPLRRLLDRAPMAVPSAYLAVHLTLGLVVVVAVAGFIALTEEALGQSGDMAAFDTAFARALHDETSEAGLRVFAIVSWLGSRDVVAGVSLVVAAVLTAQRRLVLALVWIAAQAGGALLNLALKAWFARTRPEFADPVLAAASWSFPSGHAMATFIACGVGAYLLLRGGRSWRTTVFVVSAALAWSLVMAFSRLYLGVHYVSDVIAGLIGGAAWVAVCVSALEMMHRRSPAPGHRSPVTGTR